MPKQKTLNGIPQNRLQWGQQMSQLREKKTSYYSSKGNVPYRRAAGILLRDFFPQSLLRSFHFLPYPVLHNHFAVHAVMGTRTLGGGQSQLQKVLGVGSQAEGLCSNLALGWADKGKRARCPGFYKERSPCLLLFWLFQLDNCCMLQWCKMHCKG